MRDKFSSSGPSLNLGCVLIPVGLTFVVVISSIVVSVGGSFFLTVTGANKAYAEEQLTEYVQGTSLTARTCLNLDTDGNKYISCDVMTKEGDLKTVECAAKWTFNEGCREPKLNSYVGVQ